ncbi:MAG: PLP-dependent transferase, partial [Verrucomicrobiae bacterium]|nr:PLP-dependent transferase [Verrucomicrobiae bacterium]
EDRFRDRAQGFMYSRYGNPTVGIFEERLASLEGAEAPRRREPDAHGVAQLGQPLLVGQGQRGGWGQRQGDVDRVWQVVRQLEDLALTDISEIQPTLNPVRQDDRQRSLVVRGARAEDPVGGVRLDDRGGGPRHRHPAFGGVQGVNEISGRGQVGGPAGEPALDRGRVCRIHGKSDEVERIRPPAGGPENHRSLDSPGRRRRGMDQIGLAAGNGMEIADGGFRQSGGEPSPPPRLLPRFTGRILDELDRRPGGKIRGHLVHGDVCEHRRRRRVHRIQVNEHRVPPGTQPDVLGIRGAGKTGALGHAREPQQGNQGRKRAANFAAQEGNGAHEQAQRNRADEARAGTDGHA